MKKAYVAPDAEFVTLVADEAVTSKGDLSLYSGSGIDGSLGFEEW